MSEAYRQIRLQPLTARSTEWIFLSFHDMNHVLLTVGHTDPRENARGDSGGIVHNQQFNLVPGIAQPTGGCNGDQVCSAEALISNVPFADPGTFDLSMYFYTAGTSFTWQGVTIPITQPRVLFGEGIVQVYVTLVTLISAGAP